MCTFNEIIGYESIKNKLKKYADIIKNPDKYKKYGVSFPRGVMLNGEPGLGKTMFATAFINECGIKSYILRKDSDGPEFIKKINDVFEKARDNQPSIILFDDVDKFANGDTHHKDAPEYVTIQSCLDESKKDNIFVFMTCNDEEKIPESLLRKGRINDVIQVRDPNNDDSKEILKNYLNKVECISKDFDTDVASDMLSGICTCAELESIVSEAGIIAAYNNKPYIEIDDFIKASMSFFYNAPDSSYSKEKPNIETAYHEVGHAVVGEILEPGSVKLISVGGFDGNIGGVTLFVKRDNYWDSIDLMNNRVCALLGGRAMTDIKYGKFDTGCSHDLDRAGQIVRRFLRDYAVGGFITSNNGSRPDFERDTMLETSISYDLSRQYMKVKEILANNTEFVEALVNELMDKKYLTSRDIMRIKDSVKIVA